MVEVVVLDVVLVQVLETVDWLEIVEFDEIVDSVELQELVLD